MKIRKTLALAMLALGVVGVSSCGKTEENNGGGTQQTEDLTSAKQTAVSALETYATTKLNAVTDATQKTSATQKYNDGKASLIAAINNATTQAEIDAALAAGKTAIDGYISSSTPSTPVDDLAAAKQTAVTELTTYAGTVINAITDAALKESATDKYMTNKATLEKAINDATTQAEIEAALAAGKAAIDGYALPEDTPDTVHNVSTAADFLEMLQAEQGIWEIKNDIDLSTTQITQGTKKFTGTIKGNGHTITFDAATPVSLAKSSGMLYDSLYGATIQDITFKGVNISASGDSCSMFGNVNEGATFKNVLIDGAKATFARYSGLLLAKSAGDIVLENVAAINYDLSVGDYCGVLVGDLTSAADANSTTESIKNGNLTAKNILLDGTIKGGSQCVGGVIGFVDSKVTDLKVSIDGLVGNGIISGGKNVGLGVGSFKAAGESLEIKNVLGLDLTITATTVVTDVTKVKVGLAYGLSNLTTATVENAKGIKKATSLVYDTNNDGISDADVSGNAEYVDLAAATAPTTAFTIAGGKISLGTLASVDMPQVEASSDVAMGTIADAVDDAAIGTVDGTQITFDGTIGYFHKAAINSFAGNGVAVKVTAASGVDTTGATIKINDGTATAYTSGSTLYVPTTSLTETTTITVVWNENANAQTYTINYAATATLENAPVYGAISNAEASLTASAEDATLTYTAGTVAWDSTDNGNFVTVKVAKPEWVTDPSAVAVSGATLVGTVAASDTEISVKVKLASAGAKFKVQWNATTDAKEYTIALNGATLAENPNAANITTITAEQVITAAGIATDDTGKGIAITAGTYEGLVLDAGSKRANSSTLSIEIAKAGGSSIALTTTGAAKITVSWSSTGSTNSSDLALYDASGNLVGTVQKADGTTAATAEFNVTAAGTYYIKSNGGSNTGRGARVYSITIEKIA